MEIPEPNNLFKQIPLLPNGEPDMFAVIIAGDAELRHKGNISIAVQTLLNLGFPMAHIFVLSDGEQSTPWFRWTDYPSRESVRALLSIMSRVVEEHDYFTIYITGHGHKSAIDGVEVNGSTVTYSYNTLKLNDKERMDKHEMFRLLAEIKPKGALLVIDSCYWGVFPDLPCNWRQYSATTNGSPTHGNFFGRTFWRALAEGESARAAFEIAASASPKDTPSVKHCRQSIGHKVPETFKYEDM